jgi:hypothetical protein
MKIMKTKIIVWIAPFLFLLAACNSEKVSPTNVANALKDGTWKISFYWNNDQDETSNFDGYNFIFSPNNVVTANNGTNTSTGTWYVTESGENQDESDLVLYFGSSIVFGGLNENWHVLEKTPTKVHMQHINGGAGGTDLLTFTKL